MEVELTARQVKVSKALRTQAEEGMDRIARILGKTTGASVIFRVQRHLQIAELTVKARQQTIVGKGAADTMESALRAALAHAEHQALRYRDRNLTRKRLPKEEKMMTAPPVARPRARAALREETDGANAAAARPRASIAVHSYPAKAAVVEPHILNSSQAIALKPMTIEEAVKEAEFRDRDLLVFRNHGGDLYVLHRRRDGQMELVEIP
ncbi:MAG TPA: HPF/RaiA family ribosome-associated protein [Terracidiphilus sp.]|jgi:putative sigma-54 modulation protein|nr:HPF/RaiA family ribosome-associated protein [Terracidiphilus sp.]